MVQAVRGAINMAMKAETALVLAKKEIDKKISESEIKPIGLDSTLTDENKAAPAKITGDKIDELKSDLNDLDGDIIRTKNLATESISGKYPRGAVGSAIEFGNNATYAYIRIEVEPKKHYSFSLANSGFSYVTNEDGIIIDITSNVKDENYYGFVYLMPENAKYIYWTIQNNETWLSGIPDVVVIKGTTCVVGWSTSDYPLGETISVDIPKLVIHDDSPSIPTVSTIPEIIIYSDLDVINDENVQSGVYVYTNTGYVTTSNSTDQADKYIKMDAQKVKSIKWKGRVNNTDFGYKGIVYTDENDKVLMKDNGETTSQTEDYEFISYVPENAKFIYLCMYHSYATFTFITIGKLTETILTEDNIKWVYYCGSKRKLKTLKSAIEEAEKHMDSVVYVDAETFDLVQEFGREYLDNYDGSDGMIGIWLKNRVNVIFASGSKVIFNYTGSNENIHTYFSPFNSGKYGFTLENAWVESTNCRYSVHDERGGQDDTYHNIYKRCTFIHDSSNCSWGTHQAIGGGLGVHGDIEIDGCYFENIGGEIVDPGGDAYFNVSYHNSYGDNAQSRIVIKNSYFATSALIMRHGTSEKVSEMVVCGCSLKSEPQAYNYNSTPANVKCTSWNNVIRG